MNAVPLEQLGVSLALGLLIGLQRERTEASVAGVRTFPLIAMFGTVCAILSAPFGGWVLASGLVALASLVVAANLAKLKAGEFDPGATTEVAAVLVFAVGALVVLHMTAAVIVGGVIALLLQGKEPMHRAVRGIGERDFKAIMQFVLISMVILPILPNANYGPYAVLNPFKIWLMVVLIVGISLCGYVAFKLLGTRAGTLVGGVLGGLISSTATTVSFARTSRETTTGAALFATTILIASAVVFARVLVLIAAVATPAFSSLAPPLAVMLGVMTLIAGAFYFATRRDEAQPPDPENPAELKAALIFGTLYAVIIVCVAAARDYFGHAGLYTVAAISGLVDMDAITLSTSQLVNSAQLDAPTGWRAILLASLTNIVFKTGIIAALGTRALLLRVGAMSAIALAAGALILWLWPL
jgi:uncharacterized membrane protein (DUF4010 family)